MKNKFSHANLCLRPKVCRCLKGMVIKMKNTKTCPKCGSYDIIRIDGYAGPHGSGNNIMVGMSIFSAVNVNRYICGSCGYSEEWIDQKDIERVKNSKKARC